MRSVKPSKRQFNAFRKDSGKMDMPAPDSKKAAHHERPPMLLVENYRLEGGRNRQAEGLARLAEQVARAVGLRSPRW